MGTGIQASHGHAGHGSVQQVCATLLALLGLPPGKGLAGPSLPGAPATQGSLWTIDSRYTSGDSGGYRAPATEWTRRRSPNFARWATSGRQRDRGARSVTRTAGSFNNEGLLLKQEGKTKEAIEAFEHALVVDPNLASALWNLSDLLFAENTSLDKSDTLLVRAFANGLPEGTQYLIGRAIGYQRNGQVDRSLKLLTDAAIAKPDEPEVWLFRGRYRVEQRDCASALSDFRRATRLAPANAAAFASQGIAELCADDLPAARKSFERSLALDGNQPKVREYLRFTQSRGRS